MKKILLSTLHLFACVLSLFAQDYFGDKRAEWLLKAERNDNKIFVIAIFEIEKLKSRRLLSLFIPETNLYILKDKVFRLCLS